MGIQDNGLFQDAQSLFDSFPLIFNTQVEGFQTLDRLFQAGVAFSQLFDVPLHFLNFFHLLFQFHFSLSVFIHEPGNSFLLLLKFFLRAV